MVKRAWSGPPDLLLQTAAATLLALAGCAPDAEQSPAERTPAASDPGPKPIFADGAGAAGLDFAHANGMSGEYYLAEMMGGGAALFDADGDGDLDLYLVQGHMLGPGTDAAARPTDRLYRNDLRIGPAGAPELRFTDVTASSGTLSDGYGMGVAAGDVDNDGRIDLYVTNFGANRLLRNRGGGVFEDITEASGTGDRRWSVAATFFDFDRDGWLDLYVGNYVQFSLGAHAPCPMPSGIMSYCGPGAYPPERDSLFRNRGAGADGAVTFEDVSASAGIRTEHGAATLGALAADFDGDGWLDLYVANDSVANHLWMNQRDGADGTVSFRDRALLAGVAVNQEGQPEASMGVDAGDFDGDGDFDLILTHLDQESNTLYVNDGAGLFEDASVTSGLGLPSLAYTGFGTSWLDYDNDGWLDLLAVNGAVVGLEPLIRAGDPFPLHQTNQLFRNLEGRFEEVTARAGDVFELSEVSRGAAFGDVDNDGDVDAVVVNSGGPARLLINQVGQDRRWVGLRLESHGRDALGAEVTVRTSSGLRAVRRVHTDGSYASASDPRVLVGLGESGGAVDVEVRWPDGTVEAWDGIASGRYTTLRQGEGTAQP